VKTYADALDALGDPTRRSIFERVAEQPSAVVDLAALVPVSRPAVSQHLKVLKEARLVRDTRVGTRRVYSVDPEGLAGLRDYLERFWNVQLASFKRRVEGERYHTKETKTRAQGPGGRAKESRHG